MMKLKLTFFLFVCCLAITNIYADPVNKKQAQEIAYSFISAISGNTYVKAVKTNATEEIVGNDTLSPYYIFSRGDNKGYIIVSGDNCATPIIGYTEYGNFNTDSIAPGLKDMLDYWDTIITNAKAAGAKPRENVAFGKAMKAVVGRSDVPELIKTRWNQGSPYNNLCPTDTAGHRGLTGCVATAAAQIIYYFRKDNPDTLMFDTPTYSYGYPVTTSLPHGTKIDYANMLLSGSGTAIQNNAVATLMYAIGTSSYLTYGSSTGGYITSAGSAMDSQFRISHSAAWKSGYSQLGWEELLYNQLSEKRPLLYAGYNTKNEGHAFVIDGYQASTGLFHVNYGWGGQSNGFYTVDDSTGLIGYHSGQSMCYDFAAKKQNLVGKLIINQFYQKCKNTINATISNNGTLDYSGLYLYCSTTDAMPSTSNASDETTIIPTGGDGKLSFVFKPVSETKYYLFLCDKNKNLIDSCSVLALPTVADLHLNSMSIKAGTQSTTIDNITFKTINNTNVDVKVNITNGSNATYCEPLIKCELYTYDTSTKTWTLNTTKNLASFPINAGETKDTTFAFRSLEAGIYYKAIMNHIASAGTRTNISFDSADSVVYFKTKVADLTVTKNGRNATVTGTWDDVMFTSLSNDSSVCFYDMTAVKELNSQPYSANPNSLFLSSANIDGSHNTIVNGVCDSLVINNDFEFVSPQVFTAKKARLNIKDAQVGKWGNIVVPFAASVPYGTVFRTISEVKSTTVTLNNAKSVESMTPCLYLIDSDNRNYIDAENVTIGTDSIAKTANDMFMGSTVRMTRPSDAMSFSYNSNGYPYFLSASDTLVNAFTTYIISSNEIRALKSLYGDLAYSQMADTINKAKGIYESCPNKDASARAAFAESIKAAEDAFTAQSLTTSSSIKSVSTSLSTAIDNYLQNVKDDIRSAATYSTGENVEYYSVTGAKLQSLQKGINIVRRGNVTRKIFVK